MNIANALSARSCFARDASRRAMTALVGVMGLMLLTGCAKLPTVPKPAFLTKGPAGDPLTVATTGKVPNERIASLKKLANEANSPRRDQVANELAALMPREPSPPIRAEICRTLSHFHHPTADRAVRAAAKDSEAEVRAAAMQALARHGGRGLSQAARNLEREQASRRVLAETLADEGTLDVRVEAIRSLGQFDGDDVKTALGSMLDDSNPAVQRRAMHSLAESTGKDFGNDVRAWREYVQGGTPTPRTETMSERMKNYMLRF